MSEETDFIENRANEMQTLSVGTDKSRQVGLDRIATVYKQIHEEKNA